MAFFTVADVIPGGDKYLRSIAHFRNVSSSSSAEAPYKGVGMRQAL
jgi:hypothetical protein